jgi:hypothetical protein
MIYFTCCTLSHLAQARVLGQSLSQHNKAENQQFIVFLFDKIHPELLRFQEPFELIEVSAENFPELHQYVAKFTLFEMLCYLKSEAAIYMYHQFAGEKIVYLDTDMLVLDKFETVDDLLNRKSFVITPHILEPVEVQHKEPEEKSFFNSGLYNAGFFAFRAVPAALNILTWWNSRLQHYCKVNVKKGLFVDQIWFNHLPVLFPDQTAILRHKGYNMAYWNLSERPLVWRNERYKIETDEEIIPLALYHFSGFDYTDKTQISVYQNKYSFEKMPLLQQFFNEYYQLLIEQQHVFLQKFSCVYYPAGWRRYLKEFSA